MKRFATVVLACDNEASTLRQATAIRGVLESFSLRVHFRHLVQVSHAIDFFAGDRPPSDYTILCCHGTSTERDGPHLLLGVIEGVPLDPPVGGWDEEWKSYLIRATPAWLTEHSKGGGGTFLSTGCSTGKPEIADAFVKAGYSGYIGCTEDVDTGSGTLFVLSFFHHLLAEDRDWPSEPFDDERAVERARSVDAEGLKWSTNGFRYFARRGADDPARLLLRSP